ncbi:hypothetical protein B7494_g2785 [Chlorociboria aeruginascens]|nr:hypothetical protein B7494_g2785 [Chlorociboria aeruginascens]
MSERDLSSLLSKLHSSRDYANTLSLLSTAKLTLLKLQALTPLPTTPPSLLLLAREIYEFGALASIRAKDAPAFARYVELLRGFYECSSERYPSSSSNSNNTSMLRNSNAKTSEGEQSKITGLYLLLLLTQGNYAGFHTELEGLEMREGKERKVEDDRYLGYPIRLERWLMEGSYDLVWKAMKSREVPCEEYGVFSEILTTQIRSEIASCSETAYPSLPISSTKNLLFLDSEGAVVTFAQNRGWVVKDGRIYFPGQSLKSVGEEGEMDGEGRKTAIENTLGYARELEMIV